MRMETTSPSGIPITADEECLKVITQYPTHTQKNKKNTIHTYIYIYKYVHTVQWWEFIRETKNVKKKKENTLSTKKKKEKKTIMVKKKKKENSVSSTKKKRYDQKKRGKEMGNAN